MTNKETQKEESEYSPNSYYWDGKMDAICDYEMDEDSAGDPEYVAGYKEGSIISQNKKPRD